MRARTTLPLLGRTGRGPTNILPFICGLVNPTTQLLLPFNSLTTLQPLTWSCDIICIMSGHEEKIPKMVTIEAPGAMCAIFRYWHFLQFQQFDNALGYSQFLDLKIF